MDLGNESLSPRQGIHARVILTIFDNDKIKALCELVDLLTPLNVEGAPGWVLPASKESVQCYET